MGTSRTCIHYTGIVCGNPREIRCRMSITYHSVVDVTTPGCLYRLPCVDLEDRKGHVKAECEHCHYPTPEEIAAEEAKDAAEWESMKKVLAVIGEWKVKGKPEHDRYGALECPKCGGVLRVRQVAYNGHTAAKCDTPHCFEMIE